MKRKDFLSKLGAGLAALALALMVTGCAEEAVTQAQATEIALDHAGVTQEELLSLSVDLEQEDGRQIFAIQFVTDDREYQYDVTRNKGEILDYSYQTSSQEPRAAVSPSQESPAPSSSAPQQEDAQAKSQGITQEEAQTIALNHAGVALEDAVIYRVKADVEDGRAIYDVEFSVRTTEYDYEIAQDTGEILSHDADIEGWIPRESQPEAAIQTSGEITMEQAVQLVLDRVPGATAEQVRIEEDYDDGQKKYEGEVYYDQAEYEFEITSNGTFIEWSADYDD